MTFSMQLIPRENVHFVNNKFSLLFTDFNLKKKMFIKYNYNTIKLNLIN